MRKPVIALYSLGCAKNLVDSERALAQFGTHDAVLTSDVHEADCIVVNTCAFVREADAESRAAVGEAIDATGIQFRMLNLSKGPAVQSPRAQADKYQYKDYVRGRLEQADNLTIEEGIVAEVLTAQVEHGHVVDSGRMPELPCATRGVRCTDGREFYAPCVVLTTGTFL